MIYVTYYREHKRLTISGHAESGELGRDLVCAAVSILAHTLKANLGNLKSCGQIKSYTADLAHGNAEFCYNARPSCKAIAARVFESVCVGFEILAANSPEYISYEIHGAVG